MKFRYGLAIFASYLLVCGTATFTYWATFAPDTTWAHSFKLGIVSTIIAASVVGEETFTGLTEQEAQAVGRRQVYKYLNAAIGIGVSGVLLGLFRLLWRLL